VLKEIRLASDMLIPIAAIFVLDPVAIKQQITAIRIAMRAYRMENFIGGKGKRVDGYRIAFVEPERNSRAKLSAGRLQLAESDGGTIHAETILIEAPKTLCWSRIDKSPIISQPHSSSGDLDPVRRGPRPIAEKPLTGKYIIFLFIGRPSWRSSASHEQSFTAQTEQKRSSGVYLKRRWGACRAFKK
jgi:hypothetical protein